MKSMKNGGGLVQDPYVQENFSLKQIFYVHNNYLPGNGIRRDVSRKPRRRLRPALIPPE